MCTHAHPLMCVACVWHVCGMCMACAWHVYDMSDLRLPTLSVTWLINAGNGVYMGQQLALRATAAPDQPVGELPAAARTGVFDMSFGALPSRLEMLGPALGSSEVRDVPFLQQPVVRVLGVYGETFADVTGSVSIAAFGPCSPLIDGQVRSPPRPPRDLPPSPSFSDLL